MTDDLTALRERYPAWHITVAWITRTAGPDARVLRAERGGVVLTATTPAALAEQIGQAEQTGHHGSGQ